MAARRKGAGGAKAGGVARKAASGSGKRAARRRAPPAERPQRVSAAQPIPVGRVAHYYPRRGVARLALEGPIHRGDLLHIRGQTTDLLQPVTALRRRGRPVKSAEPAQTVTLAVTERVRPGDRLYRLEFPAPAAVPEAST